MSQHDYNIANQSGSGLRSDLNSALSAIATQNSGSTAPSTTYPYQPWADSTSGLLYRRNGANSGWILDLALSGTHLYTYYLTQRVDNDFLALVGGYTGGANIELNGPSSASASNAFFDAAAHYFRSVDGATRYATLDSNGLVVGALSTADAQVNIGAGATGNRYAYLDLIGDTTYSDYGLRIIRNNSGPNTSSNIQHRGTGYLSINAEDAGYVSIGTNGSNRIEVNPTGLTTVNNGLSGAVTRSTAVPVSGSTSAIFSNVPSWVKKITVLLDGVSFGVGGVDNLFVRTRVAGASVTSGYTQNGAVIVAPGTLGTVTGITAGSTGSSFLLYSDSAANIIYGSIRLVNVTGNVWTMFANYMWGTYTGIASGRISLSGTLDGIEIRGSLSSAFDAGTVNITYEG
jgi:hypothetical protein